MKNIELLELEGKLQNPIMEFLLEHDNYLEKEQIDDILSRGESGLEDLRLILKAYNQHHLKYLEVEENIYFMSTVVLALAKLDDHESFEDMVVYIHSSPALIIATWDSYYYESFPMYYTKFPDKINRIKEVIYDSKLVIDMKRMLFIALSSMPELLERPDLNPEISRIFLEYLKFILIPENLITQDKSHETFCDTTMLFDDVISGYMNCGGDGNNPLVQQAVKEKLISEDVFFIEDLQNWIKEKCSLINIYEVNEDYKLLVNRNILNLKEREILQEKK